MLLSKIPGVLDPANFQNLFAIAASLNAAFILVSRDRQENSYTSVLIRIFDIESIVNKINPTPLQREKIMKLFKIKSTPVMCLYSFMFSILCIWLSSMSYPNCSPWFRMLYSSVTIIFTIVILSGALFGEKRTGPLRDFDENFHKLKDELGTECKKDDRRQVFAKSCEKVYQKSEQGPLRDLFRNYLQCVCMVCLICLFTIAFKSIIDWQCFKEGRLLEAPQWIIQDWLWNIIVMLSTVMPFLTFCAYSFIVRRRRNILCRFLSKRRQEPIIEKTLTYPLYCSLVTVASSALSLFALSFIWPGIIIWPFSSLGVAALLIFLLFAILFGLQWAYEKVYANALLTGVTSGAKNTFKLEPNGTGLHGLRTFMILVFAALIHFVTGVITPECLGIVILAAAIATFLSTIFEWKVLHKIVKRLKICVYGNGTADLLGKMLADEGEMVINLNEMTDGTNGACDLMIVSKNYPIEDKYKRNIKSYTIIAGLYDDDNDKTPVMKISGLGSDKVMKLVYKGLDESGAPKLCCSIIQNCSEEELNNILNLFNDVGISAY